MNTVFTAVLILEAYRQQMQEEFKLLPIHPVPYYQVEQHNYQVMGLQGRGITKVAINKPIAKLRVNRKLHPDIKYPEIDWVRLKNSKDFNK